MAQQENPNGFTSYTWNQFAFDGFLRHQAYRPTGAAFRRATAYHCNQTLLLTIVEHLGGSVVLIPNGVTVARFRDAEPLPGWPGEGGAIGFIDEFDAIGGTHHMVQGFGQRIRNQNPLNVHRLFEQIRKGGVFGGAQSGASFKPRRFRRGARC